MSIAKSTRSIMRAIRVTAFGGPEVLKLDAKVPTPTPAKNEVLIKIHAAGVNPVDTYIRSGTYARVPNLPYTPGADASGVVEEIGADVTKFKKGDRVFTVSTASGAYAEYATADIKSVGHLCDRLSFAQGASIGIPYFTATKALHLRAHAKSGETVLIHGASGAVGLAAIQLSKAAGLRVVGTAGSKEGMELVKATGADFVFNHKDDGYMKAIQDAVGGVDIVLEMLSNVNLQKDLEIVNFRGRIMIIGCRGTIEINPRLTMGKESSITGIALMTTLEPEWIEMHKILSDGQAAGWLDPKVAKVYPLANAAAAHNDVMNNQGATGKLILDTTQ